MSNIDFEVLREYSEAEIKKFNEEISAYLDPTQSPADFAPSKEAIAYFYLTLHEKEEAGCVPSTTAYKFAETIFKHATGKILTAVEMIGLSESQEKASKDVIKNIIRDGLWELQKELSEGKWGQTVDL